MPGSEFLCFTLCSLPSAPSPRTTAIDLILPLQIMKNLLYMNHFNPKILIYESLNSKSRSESTPVKQSSRSYVRSTVGFRYQNTKIMDGKWQARNHILKDEIIEIVKYPFEETLEMIGHGRISDALTVLALQRAWFFLQK
jgi:hypothetical protein